MRRSHLYGDYISVEFDQGEVVNVCYRDFRSFCHGIYTYRLPPDGAALIRRWDADPSDATLAGALFDYLTEHDDVVRRTANCEYFGASSYDKLLAYLKGVFDAAHPAPPSRKKSRRRSAAAR